MKDDAGVDFPVSSPIFGPSVVQGLKAISEFFVKNPGTIYFYYKAMADIMEQVRIYDQQIKDQEKVNSANTQTKENAWKSEKSEITKQTKKLTPPKVKELEEQEGKSAEEIKEDYVGEKNVGKFDIYRDPKTKEIIIQRKPRYGKEQIKTGIIFE
jgi:hypothetical protein